MKFNVEKIRRNSEYYEETDEDYEIDDEYSEREDENYEEIDDSFEIYEVSEEDLEKQKMEELKNRVYYKKRKQLSSLKENIINFKRNIEEGRYGFEGISNGGEIYNTGTQKYTLVKPNDREAYEELYKKSARLRKWLTGTHDLNLGKRRVFVENLKKSTHEETRNISDFLDYYMRLEMCIMIEDNYLNAVPEEYISAEDIDRLFKCSYNSVISEVAKICEEKGISKENNVLAETGKQM